MFSRNKSNPVSKIASNVRSAVPTVVSQDLHFLGNIISDGVIDFDGKIDGNIRCHTLNVRKHGIVNGEVTAEEIFVYGKVKGIIRAKNVYLYASCHIEGVILHESIAIEDGAFIDGKCKRTDKPESDSSGSYEDFEETPPPVGGLRALGNVKLIAG